MRRRSHGSTRRPRGGRDRPADHDREPITSIPPTIATSNRPSASRSGKDVTLATTLRAVDSASDRASPARACAAAARPRARRGRTRTTETLRTLKGSRPGCGFGDANTVASENPGIAAQVVRRRNRSRSNDATTAPGTMSTAAVPAQARNMAKDTSRTGRDSDAVHVLRTVVGRRSRTRRPRRRQLRSAALHRGDDGIHRVGASCLSPLCGCRRPAVLPAPVLIEAQSTT